MIFGDFSAEAPAQPKNGVRKAKCDFWDEQFQKVFGDAASARSANARTSAQQQRVWASEALNANPNFRGF